MQTLFVIAAGGAFGAMCRHFLNSGISLWLKAPFPWGTFTANVLGSFAMGVLIAVFAAHWNPSQEMRLFLTVGFLGAFTTFSTFSLDSMTLITRGEWGGAAAYILGSTILSIAAAFAGSFAVWKLTT